MTKKNGWVGHVAHMGERRGIYRVLVEKPEGRRPLGRSWHRLKLAESLRFKDRTVHPGVSWSLPHHNWQCWMSGHLQC